MSSIKLLRAREYEALHAIPPEDRPLFHITPTVGWLNDPNGFSCYQGQYHLFYQYHPYDVHWGPMHWGHCVSKDLIRWERLPAALAPDQPYDKDGCFSGSALETPDGKHLLMYTGRRYADRQEYQTQCLAIGDGLEYEKLPDNPVLTADLLPEGSSSEDFRDPKLWRDGDRWYAVLGSRTADGSGAALLFQAEGTDRPQGWRLAATLDRSRNEWGRMWECPDFFTLDGQAVLMVSPQELDAPDPAFHDGQESLCILGDWDGASFSRQKILPIDQGLDFYAPQTLLSPDGRRIMVGWMQAAGEPSDYVPPEQRWFGQLTLPRELHIRDGQLIQLPVRELERYRDAGTIRQNAPLRGLMELPSGRTADLRLRLRPEGPPAPVTLGFARDRRYETTLTYEPDSRLLVLDRSRSGFPYDLVHRRAVPIRSQAEALDLRVILDRFSVEVFVNNGEQALSATLYTPQTAQGLCLETAGRWRVDLEYYPLQVHGNGG